MPGAGARLRDGLWRWGPALVVMAAIFIASASPKSKIPDFGGWDLWVKKAGHLLGYALLGAAYLRGLAWGRRGARRDALAAVCLAGLYAITDEYHQHFVAGRGASPIDVAIDSAGAMAGVGAWLWAQARQSLGR